MSKKVVLLPADIIQLIAPYDVLSGAGLLVGSLFAVALVDALSGVELACYHEGVHTLAKASGAWTQGAKLYWDNSAKNVTTTSAGNTLIGCAYAAAQSGDATGPVLLNGTV